MEMIPRMDIRLPNDCWGHIMQFFQTYRDILSLASTTRGLYKFLCNGEINTTHVEINLKREVLIPINPSCSFGHVQKLVISSNVKVDFSRVSKTFRNIKILKIEYPIDPPAGNKTMCLGDHPSLESLDIVIRKNGLILKLSKYPRLSRLKVFGESLDWKSSGILFHVNDVENSRLEALHFRNCCLPRLSLSKLGRRLRSLYLFENTIDKDLILTSESFPHLKDLTVRTMFVIDGNEIEFSNLSLESLDVFGIPFEAFESSITKHLKKLLVEYQPHSSFCANRRQFAKLQTESPHLEELRIRINESIHISQCFERLRTLVLYFSLNDRSSISTIERCDHLTKLSLSFWTGAKVVVQHLPKLETIELTRFTLELYDQSIVVENTPKLNQLVLVECSKFPSPSQFPFDQIKILKLTKCQDSLFLTEKGYRRRVQQIDQFFGDLFGEEEQQQQQPRRENNFDEFFGDYEQQDKNEKDGGEIQTELQGFDETSPPHQFPIIEGSGEVIQNEDQVEQVEQPQRHFRKLFPTGFDDDDDDDDEVCFTVFDGRKFPALGELIVEESSTKSHDEDEEEYLIQKFENMNMLKKLELYWGQSKMFCPVMSLEGLVGLEKGILCRTWKSEDEEDIVEATGLEEFKEVFQNWIKMF